jgi:hypothetical protein
MIGALGLLGWRASALFVRSFASGANPFWITNYELEDFTAQAYMELICPNFKMALLSSKTRTLKHVVTISTCCRISYSSKLVG